MLHSQERSSSFLQGLQADILFIILEVAIYADGRQSVGGGGEDAEPAHCPVQAAAWRQEACRETRLRRFGHGVTKASGGDPPGDCSIGESGGKNWKVN